MHKYEHFKWEKEYSLPISALQHYTYCARQFALIHIEEIYEENIYTIEGNIVHEGVDNYDNYRGRNRCVNKVPVWSDKYGLYGIIDILEYKGEKLYPVEYKRGRRQKKLADEVQLCAQVMCLEEMKNTNITTAYIYYHKSRQRKEVKIDFELKKNTKIIIAETRKLIKNQIVPKADYSSSCDNCSLYELCLPEITQKSDIFNEVLRGGTDDQKS